MDPNEAITVLESFWDPDDGVLWKLRQGVFVADDLEAVVTWMRSVEVEAASVLPRRFVSLLWYLPLFLGWQVDRVREAGGDVAALEKTTVDVTNEVSRILGVP